MTKSLKIKYLQTNSHFRHTLKVLNILIIGILPNICHYTYILIRGMTDTLGRMHSDAQFAGSSSVPALVEMMGFLGMGNNPMVGATVAVAVAVQQAMTE